MLNCQENTFTDNLHIRHLSTVLEIRLCIGSNNVVPYVVDYWMPSYNGYGRHYLKVDLLNPHRINKLYIQGTTVYYVQTFNVLYSMDDLIWTAYSDTPRGEAKEFVANAGNRIVPIHFNNPFTVGTIKWTLIYRQLLIKMKLHLYLKWNKGPS